MRAARRRTRPASEPVGQRGVALCDQLVDVGGELVEQVGAVIVGEVGELRGHPVDVPRRLVAARRQARVHRHRRASVRVEAASKPLMVSAKASQVLLESANVALPFVLIP